MVRIFQGLFGYIRRILLLGVVIWGGWVYFVPGNRLFVEQVPSLMPLARAFLVDGGSRKEQEAIYLADILTVKKTISTFGVQLQITKAVFPIRVWETLLWGNGVLSHELGLTISKGNDLWLYRKIKVRSFESADKQGEYFVIKGLIMDASDSQLVFVKGNFDRKTP